MNPLLGYGTYRGVGYHVRLLPSGRWEVHVQTGGPYIRPDGTVDATRWAIVDETAGSYSEAQTLAMQVIDAMEPLDPGPELPDQIGPVGPNYKPTPTPAPTPAAPPMVGWGAGVLLLIGLMFFARGGS